MIYEMETCLRTHTSGGLAVVCLCYFKRFIMVSVPKK